MCISDPCVSISIIQALAPVAPPMASKRCCYPSEPSTSELHYCVSFLAWGPQIPGPCVHSDSRMCGQPHIHYDV